MSFRRFIGGRGALASSEKGPDRGQPNADDGGHHSLGVLVSVGTSVGLGIKQDWWIRVLAGAGAGRWRVWPTG